MSLSRILKGTHSRDIARYLFGSLNGFSGLGIATTSALLQIFGITTSALLQRREITTSALLFSPELVHAGIEEVAEPRFESQPGVEYKLWEDGVPSFFLASGV